MGGLSEKAGIIVANRLGVLVRYTCRQKLFINPILPKVPGMRMIYAIDMSLYWSEAPD